MKYIFFITLIISLLIITDSVFATQMSNQKIKLNLQFKSQTSSQSAVTPPNSTITIPKTEPDLVIKKDLYSITLGYNNMDKSPFGLSISPKTVDFGTINPTQAVTRSQEVTIQKGPSPIYSLYISENHPPQDASGSGKFVPNTTGDKDKVTISQTGYWLNPLTYGFGYRTSLFDKEDAYKQFPSLDNGLPREPVIENAGKDQSVTVITKININNNQRDTNFENIIYYTLIPSL